MDKLDFLLGDWDLDYRIPKSVFGDSRSDTGSGSIRKILGGRFMLFEYSTKSGSEADGIFARDDNPKLYRYWWFENSGSVMTATCSLVGEGILAMNWHDSLLVQTFVRRDEDTIVLTMQHPVAAGTHETVLEITMRRNRNADYSHDRFFGVEDDRRGYSRSELDE